MRDHQGSNLSHRDSRHTLLFPVSKLWIYFTQKQSPGVETCILCEPKTTVYPLIMFLLFYIISVPFRRQVIKG